MHLIVDNGGTKALWVVSDSNGLVRQITTDGMPPYFLNDEAILSICRQVQQALDLVVNSIYFYSTGCKDPDNQERFRDILAEVFPMAERVEVDTDILAAARAMCQKKAGIACILGTGSNSCLYDGEQITDNRGGLGFIIGDEGSGAALGKDLIKAFFEDRIPDGLLQEFEARYRPDRDLILEAIYRKSAPSRFLATFAPFLNQQIDHPFIRELVENQFRLFFEKCVKVYPDSERLPIYFTGSISLHFKEVVKTVGQRLGLHIKQFLVNPMDGLIEYHRKEKK